KADLFVTAAEYYVGRMMGWFQLDIDKLTKETFWPSLMDFYRAMFARLPQEPWMLAAWKAGARLSKEARSNPVLAQAYERARQWGILYFKRGQEVGAVRTDLPDDLLFGLLQAIDSAGDSWIADHWEELTTEETQKMILRLADGIRRLLMPQDQD